MITMINQPDAGGQLPAIIAPEVITDMDDVKMLRDALSEMLESILYDEDLTYCTPNNHLYIVANIINTLTRDIEKARMEEDLISRQ